MASRLKRLPSRRAALIVAGLVALIAVGIVAARREAASHAAAAGEQSAVIQPGPFASTLGLQGVITPGVVADVTAPFDGRVSRVNFEYGGLVGQGQALVELDTADLDQRRGEADAEYLRASQAATDMASWSSGQEASQAKRAEAAAAFDLADTRRKMVETKALLDRGLVAREEYEGLVQQQHGQEAALAGDRQDLAEVLKRGGGANRRVVEIGLAGARARLADLDAQRAGATVRAPVAGVIVHPPNDKLEAAGPSLHPGLALTKGQLIGVIARPGGLGVAFQLSEADANRVRAGQRVTVSGPGFGGFSLAGSVTSVAREATPASAGSGTAVSFAASARLDDLTPAQAGVIRIGMTAAVTVDLYRNLAALVAPPAAIQGEAPDTFVMVKDRRSGPPRRVAVRIGQVAPAGVEVLSGLKAGDVVVWSAKASAGADSDD
ncbi:MAG: efflux RND transporter periplasmic adaptor subunit [Caulobacteraceae bacterium]